MPLLVLSKWTGSGSITDPYRPSIRIQYPALNLFRADETDYSATVRVPVRADGPTDALTALATDPLFPPLAAVPFSFADYQKAMLAALDNWRAAKLAAGFAYGGVAYPLDTESRQDFHGILTLTNALTFPINITSLDGKTITSADQATALAIAGAALSAFVAIGQTASGYRKQINAAQTTTDLDAITFAS